jgi:hypothetical protein
MGKKKDNAGLHSARFTKRLGDRVQQFASDARGGIYTGDRLASDLATGVTDLLDLWSTFWGFGASPQVGSADFGTHPSVDWKTGLSTSVKVTDAVPTDNSAQFPANQALNAAALKLRPVDGSAAVNLQLTQVTINDDDGFNLTVSVKDLTPGNGAVAAGEYFATLYYTTQTDPTKVFVTMIRGTVT